MKHSEARLQALPLKKKVDFSYITWRLQIRDARDAYWPIGKKKMTFCCVKSILLWQMDL